MDLTQSVPRLYRPNRVFKTYLTKGTSIIILLFLFEMKNTRANFSEFRDARIGFYKWNAKVDFQTDFDWTNRRYVHTQ